MNDNTPDISAQGVEFMIRMYEQAATDAAFRKHYQRSLDERAARAALVDRVMARITPSRWTPLEIYGGAIIVLAAVAVVAWAFCEIIRL